MEEAKVFIDEMHHHPRWENVWHSVTVWLSTWDIGYKISDWDIKVAEKLDKHFAHYSKCHPFLPKDDMFSHIVLITELLTV